jgi:hypothetical protein
MMMYLAYFQIGWLGAMALLTQHPELRPVYAIGLGLWGFVAACGHVGNWMDRRKSKE